MKAKTIFHNYSYKKFIWFSDKLNVSEQDVRDADSCLTSQCLAFCQTRASKVQAIKFSLKISTHFSFYLDTKMENPSTLAKKQRVHLHWGKTLGEETSFLQVKKLRIHQKNQPQKEIKNLYLKILSATNVKEDSKLNQVWTFTSEKHTRQKMFLKQWERVRMTSL